MKHIHLLYFSDDVVLDVVFQGENEQNKGKIYKTAEFKYYLITTDCSSREGRGKG